MWNEYPGQQQHHHHHHQQGGYPPPDGPPGFPQVPQGFSSPGGYNPSYGPPPGPPPGQYGGEFRAGGFAPPQGPPPGSYGQYNDRPYATPPGPPPGDSRFDGRSYGSGPYGPPATGGYGGYNDYQAAVPPPRGEAHMPPSQMQSYGQGGPDSGATQSFQYSMCTGRKKALCIGINYTGSSNALGGCINDARAISRFLERNYGYKSEDIVLLTDDARHERQQPTRQNIIDAMQWLVSDARPDDSLFFHYSGHGGQTKDLDGDEEDGYDEVIYPLDFETAGHLVDDDLHMAMVRPLPPGCRLTSIFDSCHSGSVLDLPYIYSTEGKIKEPNLAAEAGKNLFSAATSYARGDMGGVMKGAMGIFKAATGNKSKAEKYARDTRTSPADVISWSGCKDSQTSADTSEGGQSVGAMSFSFMEALTNGGFNQTYQQLLGNIREILRNKYSQKPQLSSSHPMDTNIIFIA